MNQILTEKNFWEKYHKAVLWTEQWTDPFDEYVRIARNGVAPNTPPEYARVSDGTTASLIRKAPKRVIQQLPTGVITADDDNDWLPIVAEFILLNKIIPYANASYDLIQKFWSSVENGLTVGGQAVYTPFLKHGDEFTTDASLIYYGDIFFQPGKKSFYDCDYFFMRSWWQPETIDQVIESEKKRVKEAKSAGIEYESTWDIQALKQARKQVVAKDESAKTETEEKFGIDASGIQIITGFQRGVGATFYVGCSTGEHNDGFIVRRKKNKDPRGLPPVDYFYADVDGSNPFGRSIVEIVGGMQNMIDADMRAYKFNRALGLAPPVMTYGNVDTSQAIYEANAIIEMGNDPNNRIVPLSVDTSAINNYPNIYAMNKTQLHALFNSGGDTTVSAEVGNPGFGKTPTAIKQQRELMSADDNYIRKNFESFFENWAETAVNVYFAEREGVEVLQLDQKTADRLRHLQQKGKLDWDFVTDDNKIEIDYSNATPALRFRVDASTSKLNGQSEQLETLQLLSEIASTPIFARLVPQEKLAACWNKIVANSGVEDPEELSIDLQQFSTNGATDQASLGVDSSDAGALLPAVPESALALTPQTREPPLITQPQPPTVQSEPASSRPDGLTDPATQQVVSILRNRGVPDTAIISAIRAVRSGTPPEQVYAQIERLVNNGR